MSAVGAPIGMVGRPVGERLAPAWLTQGAAFALLALFAALQWGRLAAPSRGGRVAVCAVVAVALLVAWRLAGRLPRWPEVLASVVALVLGLIAVLAAGGVPRRLFGPGHWGDLASGLGQGLQALPAIGVPYRGVDPWVPVVLVGLGGLLLLSAAVLAARALARGRAPLGATLALTVVYAVGVVERPPGHPVLSGALLALLAGALLWADRLERVSAGAAVVFVLLAVGAGALAAPHLDRPHPWVDYQGIIDSLSTPPSVVFRWDHEYGPLQWPRRGSVMFRATARRPTYFKTVDLDRFDGVGWRGENGPHRGIGTELQAGRPSWHQRLRVTVLNLRSADYVGAGTTLSIGRSPRYVVPSAAGTYVTGRDPLRRGDSYLTDVYTPHPSNLELARASVLYPQRVMAEDLGMELPRSVGGPASRLTSGAPDSLGAVRLRFPQFGLDGGPTATDPATGRRSPGETLLRHSAYAGVYDLARRLREGAATPIDYVHAVEAHLAQGFAYTERPPAPRRGRPPLVSFLFDTQAGYCQHFSGAMALLLRMGGVPARVASGFSPGTFDAARGEWVVRDVDAHSWVEVYFPKIGWVTFDPTPGVAPPRTQLAPVVVPSPLTGRPLRRDPRRADVPHPRLPAGAPGGGGGGSRLPLALVLLVALGGGFGGAGALVALRRRRGPAPAVSPELAELHRALRRTGRPPGPLVTLRSLEERFARHAPEAAGYVAAVRLARYGGRAAGPTSAQRAALRTELSAGLGWTGRLRAWWALPPAIGRRDRV